MHYYTSQSHAILHILHITVFLRTTSNVFSSAKFFCSRDVSDAITQREVIYRFVYRDAIFLFVRGRSQITSPTWRGRGVCQ